MQPKQNTLNFILFIILSSFIFLGWGALQNWLWPPPPRPKQTVVWKLNSRQVADLLACAPGSTVTSAAPGIGNLSQLTTALQVSDWASRQSPRPQVAVKPENEPPVPKAAPLPPAKPELITLGGAGYNLRVVLTTQGAGVQSVVLTARSSPERWQFLGANTMGRPEDSPLQLVSGDRGPSNILRLYSHGEQPQDDLARPVWSVVGPRPQPGGDDQEVTFAADVPGQDVRILKTYTLHRSDYHIGLAVRFERKEGTGEPLKLRYQLMGSHNLPLEGIWYTSIYSNALIGTEDAQHHLWRDFQDARSIPQSGGRPVIKSGNRIRYAGVAVQYFASVLAVDDEQSNQDFVTEARPIVAQVRDVVEDPVTDELKLKSIYTPTAARPFLRYKVQGGMETKEGVPDTHRPFLNDISVVLESALELRPGQEVVHKYLLYNGPVKVQLLGDMGAGENAVPASLLERYIDKLHLNTLTDYQSPGWFGSFSSSIGWSYLLIQVTNFMHKILGWLHALVPNYGVCVILLTVLVRGLMHPVSRKQARTSIRMQALVPELKKLQEKYKNDRQAQAMAQMELYRKHGVSPMGSCWVVLLQMPIFMGLYYALQESIHFRLAPFLWIQNLAAPDMLLYWGQSIPWISRPEDLGNFLYLGPYLNLLPVFAVALMIVQQKFLMPPATDETQEMQQKMMKYMMIFFGIMFYKVAAGLCVYFIVSSLWGLAERQLLPKAKPVTAAGTVATGSANGPGRGAAGSSGKAVTARPKSRSPKGSSTDGTLKKVQEMWSELLKQAKKK
jgi:YidC/Oxa1 family membrane protein insertase